jgi:biotin carboxyl carrier protein
MSEKPEKPEYQKLIIGERAYETKFTRKFQGRKAYVAPDPSHITCVIPGIIQKVYVRPGQKVRKGESLCILEAMKMQNDIACPFDGTVKVIHVEPGKMMAKGGLLMEITPSHSS